MYKAVLISIQPKWCDKIANGEKTVEIRKTQPKLKPPFKCYIYCTKPKFPHEDHITLFDKQRCFYAGGKVIGEFVCDKILDICIEMSSPDDLKGHPFPCTGLTDKEIMQYLGDGNTGYGWHISDLVIYDASKKLNEFIKPCVNDLYCEECSMFREFSNQCGNKALILSRPPQSWCYVEELVMDGED